MKRTRSHATMDKNQTQKIVIYFLRKFQCRLNKNKMCSVSMCSYISNIIYVYFTKC